MLEFEVIAVFSIISAVMSCACFALLLPRVGEVNKDKIITRLTVELRETKKKLSEERSRRIQAENDSAYWQDQACNDPEIKDLFTSF